MKEDYLSTINKPFDHPLIKQLKDEAHRDQIPIMQDEGIHFLTQLLKINHAKKVLEIGTAIGYSSIIMALFGHVKVVSVERNVELYNRARNHIEEIGVSDKIELVLADANDVDIEAKDFDVIFIDAAKSSYIHFFEKFKNNLKPGGIIISDNLLFRGFVAHPEDIESRNRKQLVRKIDKYNQFIINHPEFDSYIYHIGDGISISIKK